jgi:hypothetical protein
MKNLFNKSVFSLLVLLIFVLSGCGSMRTRTDHYRGILTNINTGKYDKAVQRIKAARAQGYYEEKDRVVYYLELGMAYHYAGKYDSSNAVFELADEAMDELFTKSITKAAASILLNDNALDYFGEDYESIYVNVFKAVNYIHLNKFDDAFVEVRKAQVKLDGLKNKYMKYVDELETSKDFKAKVKMMDVPLYDDVLARYISMSLYRADGDPDDARIDVEKILELFKNLPRIYNFRLPDFLSSPVMNPVPFQVLCFTGPAPAKYPVQLSITTYDNWVNVSGSTDKRFWMNIPMPVQSGYHFKFQLPEIKEIPTAVKRIDIYANDRLLGSTDMLENMQNVAISTFRTHQSVIYFKTVVRAVLKGLAAAEAKEELRKQSNDQLVNFLTDLATDIAVDATENADLRFWRTMPGYAWAGEFMLEPGSYSIRIEYKNAQGMLIAKKVYPDIKISPDKLNFIESYIPN